LGSLCNLVQDIHDTVDHPNVYLIGEQLGDLSLFRYWVIVIVRRCRLIGDQPVHQLGIQRVNQIAAIGFGEARQFSV